MRDAAPDTASLTEQQFRVPDMHCEGCAEKIVTALTALPGVREVKPQVAQKRISVRFEPARVQPNDLKHATEAAGFTVLPA